jgi:hypothetical protein
LSYDDGNIVPSRGGICNARPKNEKMPWRPAQKTAVCGKNKRKTA